MSQYGITLAARSDLREMIRYVAANNPPAALRLRWELVLTFERLAVSPGIGHPRRDLSSDPSLRFGAWNAIKLFTVAA